MYTLWTRNMTVINSEEVCFHNDESTFEEYKVTSATLSLSEGAAGSLNFKVPKTNVGYSQFELLGSQIVVRKNGASTPYWVGRLLNSSEDFYGNATYTVEGIYNYLMDTVQLQYHASSYPRAWLTYLIEEHNEQCIARGEYYKIVKIGGLDPALDPASLTDFYTDYETTLDCVNNIIEGYNGHLRINYVYGNSYTYSNGVVVNYPNGEYFWNIEISVYTTYETVNNMPTIEFGENLTDYTREKDVDELASIIIPKGKAYTDDEYNTLVYPSYSTETPLEDPQMPKIEGMDLYRTIYSVNNHVMYLAADSAHLNQFTGIAKVVEFSDCDNYYDLLALGQQYLQDQKWIGITLTIDAIDAKLLGADVDEIKIGRLVHCYSAPHGLNYNYPCTAISEDLLDVSGTTFTLGIKDDNYLTSSSRKTDEKLKELVLDSRRREVLLSSNINTATDGKIDTAKTQILTSPTEYFTNVYESIQEGMEEAAELATVYDKGYTMNLLNIFDSELNPNKKGYVHFLREHADYSIDDSKMTLDKLKQRVLKYTPSGSVSAVNNFFNYCKNIMNTPSLNQDYTITVVLGTEEYQTNIAVTNNSAGTKDGIKVPYINSSRENCYSYYNGGSYAFNGALVQVDGSHTGVLYSSMYTFGYNSGVNSNMFTYYSYNWPRSCAAYPNKATLDTETTRGYQVYVSRDIYSDSTLNTVYKQQNLFAEAKKTAMSMYDVRQKFLNAVSSEEYKNRVNTMFDDIQQNYFNDTNLVVAVFDKTNSGNMSITVLNFSANYSNNGSPMLYNNLYFARYGTTGSDPNSRRVRVLGIKNSTNLYYSNDASTFKINSDTTIKPNFSGTDAGYFSFYPNIPSLTNPDFEVYISAQIVDSSDVSNVLYVQNLFNSNEPYLNEQDHIYEIVISNTKDYMNSSTDNWCWRWNQYGLYALQGGYSESVLPDGTYQDANDRVRLALTYDGNIVADRITAGVLNAGIVKAGYLTSWESSVDPSDPAGTANFVLDIDNGRMLARKGTLLFNGTNNGGSEIGNAKSTSNNFLYLSNYPTDTWFDISGERSKDWMFILGSSFGVDKYGRCFMREGIIGAAGGVFAVHGYNEEYVTCRWNSTQTSGVSELKYNLTLNTDSYRPVINQSSMLSNEACAFRWRLAHYNNNTLEFLTSLNSFYFEPGNSSYKYTRISFDTPITYNGSISEAEAALGTVYYDGELFPVWYRLEDTATEDYYEQDGHRYVIIDAASIDITGSFQNDPTQPQYTSTSDYRYVNSGIASNGAVYVGNGYIYQGSIGANASFSLSGINRIATLSVPDGAGHSTTTRDDWRLTVGSKLGVTDDGTLYCTGAYMRNMHADATVTASYVDTDNVGGVRLNTHQSTDGDVYTYNFRYECSRYGSKLNPLFKIWLESGTYYDHNSRQTNPIQLVDGSVPQTGFYGNINFTLNINGLFMNENDATQGQSALVGTFTGEQYLKNTLTKADGSSYQSFYLGDTSGWDYSAPWVLIKLDASFQMTNEHSSNPIWEMTSFTNAGDNDEYFIRGTFTVQKVAANGTRAAMDVGGRDIIGNSSSWLGGPSRLWSQIFCNTLNYTTLVQNSSRLYKSDIQSLDGTYDTIFDELRPVSYYINNAEKHVRHTGFVMEEVGDILEKHHIEAEKLGAYNPNEDADGGSLNYIDFIAINTRQIQKLKQRVKELEERLYEVEKDEDRDNI